MSDKKATAQRATKARKARKLGSNLTHAQRDELFQIPSRGFVVVKPTSRRLTPKELETYTWVLDRNVISLLESQGMVEPVCIPGNLHYGYRLTYQGHLVVAFLMNPGEDIAKLKSGVEATVTPTKVGAEDDAEESVERAA